MDGTFHTHQKSRRITTPATNKTKPKCPSKRSIVRTWSSFQETIYSLQGAQSSLACLSSARKQDTLLQSQVARYTSLSWNDAGPSKENPRSVLSWGHARLWWGPAGPLERAWGELSEWSAKIPSSSKICNSEMWNLKRSRKVIRSSWQVKPTSCLEPP